MKNKTYYEELIRNVEMLDEYINAIINDILADAANKKSSYKEKKEISETKTYLEKAKYYLNGLKGYIKADMHKNYKTNYEIFMKQKIALSKDDWINTLCFLLNDLGLADYIDVPFPFEVTRKDIADWFDMESVYNERKDS